MKSRRSVHQLVNYVRRRAESNCSWLLWALYSCIVCFSVYRWQI